jgi:hypothetical protein
VRIALNHGLIASAPEGEEPASAGN